MPAFNAERARSHGSIKKHTKYKQPAGNGISHEKSRNPDIPQRTRKNIIIRIMTGVNIRKFREGFFRKIGTIS